MGRRLLGSQEPRARLACSEECTLQVKFHGTAYAHHMFPLCSWRAKTAFVYQHIVSTNAKEAAKSSLAADLLPEAALGPDSAPH